METCHIFALLRKLGADLRVAHERRASCKIVGNDFNKSKQSSRTTSPNRWELRVVYAVVSNLLVWG